jgi:tetratricopeptide (TPR) repeat protein
MRFVYVLSLLVIATGLVQLEGAERSARACAFCPDIQGSQTFVVSFSPKSDHALIWEQDIGSDEGNGGEDRGGGSFYVVDGAGTKVATIAIDPSRFFWRMVWEQLSWKDEEELKAFVRHGALPKELKKAIKTFDLKAFPAEGLLASTKERGVLLSYASKKEGRVQLYDSAGMTLLTSLDLVTAEEASNYATNQVVRMTWSPSGRMLVLTGSEMTFTPGNLEEESDEDEMVAGEIELHSILQVFSYPKKQKTTPMTKRKLAEYYNARGYAAYKAEKLESGMGDGEEEAESASEFYLKAVEIDPTYEMAIYNAACAQQSEGQTEEAYKLLERLKKMKTRKARKRLHRARKDADFKGIRNEERFKALVGKK